MTKEERAKVKLQAKLRDWNSPGERLTGADAELAQLHTRHHKLRHLAGALVSDAEDGTSKLLKRWPVLAAYIERTANQVRNHLKSEERS